MSASLFRNLPDLIGILGGRCEWGYLPVGREGFRRWLPAGVEHVRPPLPEALGWIRRREGYFELALNARPQRVHTLRSFCEQLRSQSAQWQSVRCGSEALPEELRKLDQIAQAILTLAEGLHARGWGLGLLTPENIVIFEFPSSIEVFFWDLGFYWGDRQHLAPIPPPWLLSAKEGNKYALLWDEGDALRQESRQMPQPATLFDPTPDVRMLGRIFVSALIGDFWSQLPDATQFPETRAQRAGVPNARRVWVTLQRAVDGKIRSIAQLAEALRLTPLSQHFLADAPVPLLRRKSLLAIPLVVALAVGTYLFRPRADNGSAGDNQNRLPGPPSKPSAPDELLRFIRERREKAKKLVEKFTESPSKEFFETKRELQNIYNQVVEKESEVNGLAGDVIEEYKLCREYLKRILGDFGFRGS